MTKSFHESRYPVTIWVGVNIPFLLDIREFSDAIKGLNPGHALWLARKNWPDCEVRQLTFRQAKIVDMREWLRNVSYFWEGMSDKLVMQLISEKYDGGIRQFLRNSHWIFVR